MTFGYVLVAFSTSAPPPDSRKLKSRSDYTFAPLAADGRIYTIDFDLWGNVGAPDMQIKTFCPGREEILAAWSRCTSEKCAFLMGLIQRDHVVPPGRSGERLPLQRATDLIASSESLLDLGFDVVDQLTGVSGLANVGYNQNDLEVLRTIEVTANRYNLLRSAQDAETFAQFASAAAPEHAPFSPVRVVGRLPSGGA